MAKNKTMNRHILSLLLFLAIFGVKNSLFSQASISDSSILLPNLKLGASAGFPSNDLKKTFGTSAIINTKFDVKFKSQWFIGAQYNFLFGGSVKDSGMLDELITDGGGIINTNGEFGTFEMLQRGHHVGIHVGRLFSVLAPNANSGIITSFGVGIFTYKINFNNISGDLIQLNGEYSKGYDRYTAGNSFTEFIGYQYFSNNRLANFYAGVEFTQAFTKIRRGYQVDFEENDPRFGARMDNIFSIQVGWILPLYKRPPKEFYY